MQSSMVDQLQHIDTQLMQCELLPGEQAAVDEFRVWALQVRQERHNLLGPYPAGDMVERSAWQARKQQMDAAMEPDIESEKMLRGAVLQLVVPETLAVKQSVCRFQTGGMCFSQAGLEHAWGKHQERERLRQLRYNLLGGQEVGKFFTAKLLSDTLCVSSGVAHLINVEVCSCLGSCRCPCVSNESGWTLWSGQHDTQLD